MPAIRAALAVTCGLICGCASDREVVVHLPLTRLELPEPGPRTFAIGGSAGQVASARLTRDQTTTEPDTTNPELIREGEDGSQLRFDWYILPPLAVTARSFGEDLAGAQVKWHVLSPLQRGGRASLAVTAALGRGSPEFLYNEDSSNETSTHIEQDLVDIAAVFGWRASPSMLIFGGPYLARHEYDGRYVSERGSDPDIDTRFSGSATLVGANVGAAYTPVNWFSGIGELSFASVEAGASRDQMVTLSAGVRFHFARLIQKRITPKREPPVEVVPAE